MSVYSLHMSVYENGTLHDWDFYSGQELSSLVDTIHCLWQPTYNSMLSFDVRDDANGHPMLACTNGDDENAPFPEEWLLRTLDYGYGKTARSYRLVGDQIPIQPEQYGLSPWPTDVKVRFEIC